MTSICESRLQRQYIKPNQGAYDIGQQQLGTGLTDAELRNQNIAYERTGKAAIAVTTCFASSDTACNAATSGLAIPLCSGSQGLLVDFMEERWVSSTGRSTF